MYIEREEIAIIILVLNNSNVINMALYMAVLTMKYRKSYFPVSRMMRVC